MPPFPGTNILPERSQFNTAAGLADNEYILWIDFQALANDWLGLSRQEKVKIALKQEVFPSMFHCLHAVVRIQLAVDTL